MLGDSGMLNRGDGQRGWLDNFYNRIAQKQAQVRVQAGQKKIAKYADFVCEACSKMFTKQAAIDMLQGVCDHCGNEVTAVAELQQREEAKKEDSYECLGCNADVKKSQLKKGFLCECGSGGFVSKKLLGKVIANSAYYLESKGIQVEDMFHEKGTIYANIGGVLPDGRPWKTIIAATGRFTENDVIMFNWTEESGEGIVATAQNDKLIPFVKNTNCALEWVTEDEHFNPETVIAGFHDARGVQISLGSNVSWYQANGPVKGEVVDATQEGNIIVGITQDVMGRAKGGSYLQHVELSPEDIRALGVETY